MLCLVGASTFLSVKGFVSEMLQTAGSSKVVSRKGFPGCKFKNERCKLQILKLVRDNEIEVNQRWQTTPKVKYQLTPDN